MADQELSIRITTSAESAVKSLEKLEGTLNGLSVGLSAASAAAQNISVTFSKLNNGSLSKASQDLAKMSRVIEKITSNFDNAAQRSDDLGESVKRTSRLGEALRTGLGAIGDIGQVGAAAFQLTTGAVRETLGALREIGSLTSKTLSIAAAPFKFIAERMGSLLLSFRALFTFAQKSVSNVFAGAVKGFGRITRIMRLMLIRKALNAILKDLGESMKSLAGFTGKVGQDFNRSMSLLKSDFKWLGANIAAAFAPIINYAVPYIDALIEKIVGGVNALNEFFAALTGADSFVVARRAMSDYAESAEDASEAQQELNRQLAAFDKLNVLSSGKKDSKAKTPTIEWDEKKVSAKVKKFSDQMKKITKRIGDTLKTLFDPLKSAWDIAGDHVLSGLDRLLSGVRGLASQIGSDFMRMWREKETQQIFENLLHTFGSLSEAGGILAEKLSAALKMDDRGLHIWESLRNIVLVLSDHLKNMGEATKEWAENLDLNPIIEATEKWLKSLERVADFIGGIAEDIYTKIILPFAQWTVETGIPELMDIFTDFNNKVDWEGLREHLSGVWSALEKFGEHVGEGLLAFIRGMSDALANFLNSDTFKDFLDFLAEKIPLIDFKNVGEGIAQAISSIATTLVNFVFIPAFEAFLNLLVWFSNQHPERIAEELKLVAKAIIAIKLSQFTGAVVDKFRTFATLTAGTNWEKAGSALSVLARGFRAVVAAIAGWEIGKSLASILRNEHMAADQTLEDFEDIRLAAHGLMRDSSGAVQEATDEYLKSFGLIRQGSGNIKEVLAFTEEGAEAIKKYGNNVVSASEAVGAHLWADMKNVSKALGDANAAGGTYAADTMKNFKDVDMAVHNSAGVVVQEMETATRSMESTSKSVGDTQRKMKEFYESIGNTMNVKAALQEIPTTFRDAFQRSRNNVHEILSRISDMIDDFVRKTKRSLDSLIAKMEKVANASSGSGTFEIPEYATGGIVPSGQIFMARENGVAEMVGSMGGHVAVANNDQIVSGIAQGVYSAVKRAMMDGGGNGDSADIVINMDGNEIYRVVRKRDMDFKRQTGFSGFSYG